MTGKIRLAIVDDHPIVRMGLNHALKSTATIKVVAEGATAEDAIRIARELAPDVMLVDVSMPGDGLRAARQILQEKPAPRVIMLTVSENEDHMMAAFDSGASGYVLKGTDVATLIRIVHSVHEGATYASPELAGLALWRKLARAGEGATDGPEQLTPEEVEVQRCVAQGMTNKQIAATLGVSPNVVKWRLSQLMRKLNAKNRTATAMALRARN